MKTVSRPRQRSGRVGRNSPCPCGSGKKLKACCVFVKANYMRALELVNKMAREAAEANQSEGEAE